MRATPNDAGRHRYEAIYRAVGRSSRRGLWLCLAATVVVAVVYVVWLAPIGARALIGSGLPLWLVAGLQTAIVLSVAMTLPNLAQLLVIRGETAAAIEAFNAWGIAETARWHPDSVPIARIRKAEQVLPWLARHPEIRGPLLVRFLAWAGEIESARAELARMPRRTPADVFEVFLLGAMVDFVATGGGDLQAAREAMAELPTADHDRARLSLALEEARRDLTDGRPWQTPLAMVRREVEIPRAATILGRFLSGARAASVVVVIGTSGAILLTLMR